MKYYIAIFLCAALLPRLAVGQCFSSQEKPAWVDGYFHEESNSYIEMASANGASETEARNKAAQVVMERRSLATGQRVKVEVRNGNVAVTGGDQLTVKSRVVDEYREQCGRDYRVSLLVQTAKNPTYELERVKVTNTYGFSPRAFVPGMAQLHKGSTAKGIFFIVGEIALVGGVVACEGLRTSYESKINSTHNTHDRQAYINNADNMQNLRNGFIAGAVALYAWNIIDGIVAKGKKHVVLGSSNLRFAPYASPQSNGVVLSYKF